MSEARKKAEEAVDIKIEQFQGELEKIKSEVAISILVRGQTGPPFKGAVKHTGFGKSDEVSDFCS